MRIEFARVHRVIVRENAFAASRPQTRPPPMVRLPAAMLTDRGLRVLRAISRYCKRYGAWPSAADVAKAITPIDFSCASKPTASSNSTMPATGDQRFRCSTLETRSVPSNDPKSVFPSGLPDLWA